MPSRGKVKWFSNVKGYGFLTAEGVEGDIFVHYKAIQAEGYKTLKEEEEVEFELVNSEKGPQASNVVRLGKPKKAEAGTGVGAGPEKPEKAAKADKGDKGANPKKES